VAGKSATLSIDIVADATQATTALDEAARSASNTAEKIDDIGGRSGDTATGLGALSGALSAAGFDGAANSLGLVATAMDATEGATILYKVAQESLTVAHIKDTAAKIANTAQTVASTVASTAANAATKVWAATQWLLNAAMSANPIGLIIGLVVGLIAVIVLIATKTTWFQDAWAVAWSAIQTAGKVALDALKIPIDAIVTAFDAVVSAIKSVIDWFKKIKIPDALAKAGEIIGGIWPFAATPPGAGTRSFAPSTTGLSAGALGTSSRAGAGGVTINVNVPEASDPVATARYLKALIRRGEASGVLFGSP
jgi:F0F1-type ATP synthase assembly protein I